MRRTLDPEVWNRDATWLAATLFATFTWAPLAAWLFDQQGHDPRASTDAVGVALALLFLVITIGYGLLIKRFDWVRSRGADSDQLITEARARSLPLRHNPTTAVFYTNRARLEVTVQNSGLRVRAIARGWLDGVRVFPAYEPGRDDLQLGERWLDDHLRIESADEASTRALLMHPPVRTQVEARLQRGECWTIRDGQVEVLFPDFPPGSLSGRVDEMLHFVEVLAAGWDHSREQPMPHPDEQRVRDIAQQRGLTFRLSDRRKTWSISGHVGSIDVSVDGGTDHGTCVRSRTREPSTWQLRVTHIDSGSGPSHPLADPVLARTLHLQTSDPERALALLEAEKERILALIHGHPGSTLTAEGVEVLSKGAVDGLGELVDDAMAVCRALDASAAKA